MLIRPLRVIAAALLLAGSARAGGFTTPDNGAEALGRGGAFTAKADTPLAIAHNPAGLAQQRGTAILVGANITESELTFQRSGIYPDRAGDPRTPWGGTRFPAVTGHGQPGVVPLLAVASDLGLERLTFAAGVFAPPVINTGSFPLTVGGKPSPARYDEVGGTSILAYPTLSLGARLLSWLDVGVSGHLVIGRFDVTSIASADISRVVCPNQEYQPCDSRVDVNTAGTGWAASAGAILHASDAVDVAFAARTSSTVATTGTMTPTAPGALPIELARTTARFDVTLPWDLRAGLRWVARTRVGRTLRERGDVELDATYEPWSAAQGSGPRIATGPVGPLPAASMVLLHGYRDTRSLRLGGAVRVPGEKCTVIVRAGAFYDSSATTPATTRLDFDTLAKVALTAGIGLEAGRVMLDLGYAEIFERSRIVSGGVLRPLNAATRGGSAGPDGALYGAVNNGRYDGHARIIALSAGVRFGGAPR